MQTVVFHLSVFVSLKTDHEKMSCTILNFFPSNRTFSLRFAPFKENFGSTIKFGIDIRALQKTSFKFEAFTHGTE